MTNKRITKTASNEALRAALDVGNGEASGVSNERPYDPISFEPVIAPMTEKRALSKADERPTFSLKKDGEILVFGVNDVFSHGKQESLRRQNGTDRYTEADYFNLLDVQLLNLFASHRGAPETISPTLAINLPVEHFNNDETVQEVKDTLVGKREIADYEGCVLSLYIDADKLIIMPESTGALFHWAYDPRTATRRPEVDTGGSTLVIDIGYETTDCTLFEGMKYRRDRAFTIRRAGMGNVVRSVRDYLLATNAVRDVDESRLDLALRAVAGLRPGDEKWIEISGKEIEVTEVYDHSLSNEVQRITTRVKSLYTEDVTRALLAGGSVYHMRPVISSLLPFYVVVAPDPAHANVFGAYTALKVRDNRKG